MIRKLEKAFAILLIKIVALFKPGFATHLVIYFYGRWGMVFVGTPNYISSRSWFDGTDYSRISIGNGSTISSNVSFLTHDWSPNTVAASIGENTKPPLGRHGTIEIGDYSFIGRGATLLPGSVIGRGAIVGAGAVVRGVVPDYAIYIGNPGCVVGDSKEYVRKIQRRQKQG